MQRQKVSRRLPFVLGILVLAGCSYVAERRNDGDLASWSHILGLVLVVWYLWLLLRDRSAVVLTSFYQLFYSLGMLIGAAIISSGAHMIEIEYYGTANGFFWIMVIYFVIGMEMTRVGYSFGDRIHLGLAVQQFSSSINRLAILIIVGPILAIATYVFVRTGGPLLSGVDRVTFWREMAPAGTSLVRSLLIQSFFFAAFYFLWQRRIHRSMILPSIVIIGYILSALLVLGEKFSVFVIFLNTWLLLLAGIFSGFRLKLKHFALMGILVVTILLYTTITYLLSGKDASFVLTRAALQAQLLWSVFNDTDALSLLPREPACYFGCGSFSGGSDYISYKYLPEYRYIFYRDGGNSLSGFMPALSILTFGVIVSILVHLTVSFVLGFTQRKMVASFASENPIYGFLLFKVQFALTLIWFAAQDGPLHGLAFTLALIVAYRIIFSKRRNVSRRNGIGRLRTAE